MNKQPPHLPSFNSQTSHESQYHHSVSVLIVGAGPTGLAAANFLGLANIDTLQTSMPSISQASTCWSG